MGFELVEPGEFRHIDPLPPGFASISKSGKLVMHKSDLESIKVGREAALLADVETWRLALRMLHDGEKGIAVSVVTKGKAKADSGKRAVSAGRAIRRIGLEPEVVRGRYELHTKGGGSDGLLIVHLMPETVGAKHGKKDAK